jgi:hypothetical protein
MLDLGAGGVKSTTINLSFAEFVVLTLFSKPMLPQRRFSEDVKFLPSIDVMLTLLTINVICVFFAYCGVQCMLCCVFIFHVYFLAIFLYLTVFDLSC